MSKEETGGWESSETGGLFEEKGCSEEESFKEKKSEEEDFMSLNDKEGNETEVEVESFTTNKLKPSAISEEENEATNSRA